MMIIRKFFMSSEMVKNTLHCRTTWIYYIDGHNSGNWNLMFPNASIFTLAQLTIMVLTISMEYWLTLLHHTATLVFFLMTNLKFCDHATQVTTKANRVLGLIKKSFEYLDSTMLIPLFSTLVWPVLEYNNTIWGPRYTLDKRKMEKVQQRATRLLPCLHGKFYAERLTLTIPPIQTIDRWPNFPLQSSNYKQLLWYWFYWFIYLLHNYYTRGYQFKLFKERSRLLCRSN